MSEASQLALQLHGPKRADCQNPGRGVGYRAKRGLGPSKRLLRTPPLALVPGSLRAWGLVAVPTDWPWPPVSILFTNLPKMTG